MIYICIIFLYINEDESSRNKNLVVTGDPGDMIFGTYLMGLCLLDGKLVSKKDPNPNPLFMKLESDWRVFADYMVYKVTNLFFSWNKILKVIKSFKLPSVLIVRSTLVLIFQKVFQVILHLQRLILQENKQRWIQWITPFVQKSPIPIVQVYDFLWWCSYGLKYQHDLNR